MIESDLELVEKQATAKGWLAKIENQGVLDFGSADSLTCDKGLDFGLGDFTLFFQLNFIDFTPSKGADILKTHNESTSSMMLKLQENGDFRLVFWDDLGAGAIFDITPIINLIGGDTYIFALELDRDGLAKLYAYNVDDIYMGWGFIGSVDISSTSTIFIGHSTSQHSVFFNDLDTIGQAWPLPPINRAMTSEEIHAYVSGIGSPNSLPEDLRGVGDLDAYFNPNFATEDGGVYYSGSTGSIGNTVDSEDCMTISADGSNPQPRALWSLSTDLGLDAGTALRVEGLVYLPSSNTSGDQVSLSYHDGSGYVVMETTTVTSNWTYISGYIPYGDVTTLAFILTGSSSITSSGDEVHFAYLKAYRTGQIFSCRPHRDGIHTDDTGNGYNWTNVGSPTIKPFSAGIR